jgi:hypothetical protein
MIQPTRKLSAPLLLVLLASSLPASETPSMETMRRDEIAVEGLRFLKRTLT